MFIIFVWALVDVILGVIWLVTNKSAAAPPQTPPGTQTVECTRCNAVQNISLGAQAFECWQCATRQACA